jgi:thioester reductase-like protein
MAKDGFGADKMMFQEIEMSVALIIHAAATISFRAL